MSLKKIKSSEHWDSLEKKKALMNEKKPEKGAAPGGEDPGAGLMDMMKEMYQNGDPEMKKIIAESWTKAQTKSPMDS